VRRLGLDHRHGVLPEDDALTEVVAADVRERAARGVVRLDELDALRDADLALRLDTGVVVLVPLDELAVPGEPT
jgi:hypothetical protein